MKKIEAIIKPATFDEVKEALIQAGVSSFTVTETSVFGQHDEGAMMVRGASYHAALVPRLKLEILTSDAHVAPLLRALEASARTGRPGDGKIIVTHIEELIRIRTGERGESAL